METERKKEIANILIVDDISINVEILENIITAEGYEALCASSVQEALDIMKDVMPQLILSDLSMPEINGIEFCKLLKSNPITREIPFVFITVADSNEEKQAAFLAGAVDYILKPFERSEVIMRVNNHLNAYRIKQELEGYNRMMHKVIAEQKRMMEKERENLLLALAKLVERRNIHLGGHLERIGYNCHLLAQSLQLVPKFEQEITEEFIDRIGTAAKLHDIGTLIMPDKVATGKEIYSKEGIRFHTEEGAKFLEDISAQSSSKQFLDLAILIARYHHAHWDGTGYPEGLCGEQIPLAARIAVVVNGFDSLEANHQGEERVSIEQRVQAINEKSGIIYDPDIVQVFNKIIKQLKTDSGKFVPEGC